MTNQCGTQAQLPLVAGSKNSSLFHFAALIQRLRGCAASSIISATKTLSLFLKLWLKVLPQIFFLVDFTATISFSVASFVL